jgi:hypothetical protein
MTRYKGRAKTSLIERGFPHRVEMIVPKGGFGNAWTPCTTGTVRVASSQGLVAANVTRITAIM